MPVLHRLPQSAGVVSQKTGGSAAVCHGVLGTIMPLRPQPRRYGRFTASRTAEVGAYTGCHVRLRKVRLKCGPEGCLMRGAHKETINLNKETLNHSKENSNCDVHDRRAAHIKHLIRIKK